MTIGVDIAANVSADQVRAKIVASVKTSAAENLQQQGLDVPQDRIAVTLL
jgi:hypothetical protein